MEDYKKKYEHLVAKLKEAYYDEGVNDERYCCVIHDILPELKESEDERIREALIEMMHDTPSEEIRAYGVDKEKTLAWLEKQGEQKPISAKDLDERLSDIEGKLGDIYEKVSKPYQDVQYVPFQQAQCWLPDGTCANPYRDCTNCPRPNLGGYNTTTSTNFDNNK